MNRKDSLQAFSSTTIMSKLTIKRIIRMFVLPSQVLSVWDHLPGGRKDPGHAGPEHSGKEAGMVRYHCPRRTLCPRTHPPSPLLLPAH